MRAPAKRTAMLILAALAVLAALLILVLPGGSGQSRHQRTRFGAVGQSDTQVAAAYLGISTVELRRRLHSGLTLAEVAEAGKGTSSQGLLRALLQAHTATLEKRGLSAGERRERLAGISHRLKKELRQARRGQSRELALASGYLGLDVTTLVARMASGKSLAEVASTTAGKSRSGLIEALTGPRERRLNAAAASHQITAAAAQGAIDTFRARTAKEVDHKGPPGTG
jgi:hypothetical protein